MTHKEREAYSNLRGFAKCLRMTGSEENLRLSEHIEIAREAILVANANNGLKDNPLLTAAISVAQGKELRLARMVGRYQELELKILAVSGLKLEQILDMFAAGYTMERNISSESLASLSESTEP